MDPFERAKHCFFQALEQQQAGRWTAAEKLYREALQLVPDRPSVLVNLSAVLIRQQRHAEALRVCERVLTQDPHQADALQNAALCRRELFGEEVALDLVERALAHDPDDVQALNNRGIALRQGGRLAEAVASFDRALALQPGMIGALANRGAAMIELGRADAALADFAAALQQDPDFLQAQQGLYEVCANEPMLARSVGAEVEALALRAANEPWGRPQALAPFLLQRLRAAPDWNRWFARHESGSTTELLDPPRWRHLAAQPVLAVLLTRMLLPDPALERLLVVLRRSLTRLAMDDAPGASVDPARLALQAALAQQCFLNDYLYPVGAAEKVLVQALRTRAERLDPAQPLPSTWLATLASYAPLGESAPDTLQREIAGGEALAALRHQQVDAPREERALEPGIGRLSAPDAATASPRDAERRGPLWTGLPRWRSVHPLPAYLANRISGLRPEDLPRVERARVLAVDSGSGQGAIELAQGLAAAEVLALDRSRRRLAYAKRMARGLGIGNLRFAQAEVPALSGSPLRFELIEATGALRRCSDPSATLAVLHGLLQPGGVMRLALYSAKARGALAAAQAHVAARGYGDDAEGVRACRADVFASSPDAPLRGLLAFREFYDAGECGELLFGTPAATLDAAALAALLAARGLALLGFELDPGRRAAFRRIFPAPEALRDLAAWQRFDTAHPDPFVRSHPCWVRRMP
jgi:tetratricopeptide (TPR) repeat protein